ncbi:MAG: hypothetical protein NNA18_09395 [Nitrospira sp.]|nr:hypothetical protein [Nitrospira sp.]
MFPQNYYFSRPPTEEGNYSRWQAWLGREATAKLLVLEGLSHFAPVLLRIATIQYSSGGMVLLLSSLSKNGQDISHMSWSCWQFEQVMGNASHGMIADTAKEDSSLTTWYLLLAVSACMY